MNKIYLKLIAITLALVLSASVVVMSSYAWFVLSGNPAVNGIQVAIGGGNTILVAADLVETVDGVAYHYPDVFSDKLNFGVHRSYIYLQSLAGLTPVSTADGINWFLPSYYDATDKEVQKGKIPSGQLKNVEDFILDYELTHANLSGEDEKAVAEGSYIYLDFWVVSPGADYTLRVSTGEDSGGSFLIDLLQPIEVKDNTGVHYTLDNPNGEASAAARVGFLVNPDRVVDDTMLYYQNSIAFDERYKELRGSYQDTGSTMVYSSAYRFTIYEPNGDYHPNGVVEQGCYVHTYPIAMVGGIPTAVSVANQVTVQKRSIWRIANAAGDIDIEQAFQTSIYGKDLEYVKASELFESFYGKYLQGQLSPYIDKGEFIKKTADLDKYNTSVTAAELEALDEAGATDDVYIIRLERNIPQRIRMFIWLEGQDVDCNDSVGSSNFALNIEFAGSTVE